MDKNDSPDTAGFNNLLGLVNGNLELAKTLETVWGDAETAIDWLNKRVPRQRNKGPVNYRRTAKGTEELNQEMPPWYDAPRHRTVLEKKVKK
jgi:hypothetical protein